MLKQTMQNSPHGDARPPPPEALYLVMWVIWAALQVGLVVIYFILGDTAGSRDATEHEAIVRTESMTWMVALLPLAISGVIRWLVLPSRNSIEQVFPFFIAGIALAESCGVIGTVMYPDRKSGLLVLGLIGIWQFIPFFAKRLLPQGDADDDEPDRHRGIPRQP